MDLGNFQQEHFAFIVTLAFYLFPAIVGASISTYTKSLEPDAPKRSSLHNVLLTFLSALVPAMFLAMFHTYIETLVPLSSLRIGVGFFFGCVGDETLDIVTSLRKTLATMKALSNHNEKLKKVTDVAETVINAVDAEREKERPKPKQDPPPEPHKPETKPVTPPPSDDDYDDSDDYYVE